LILSLLQIHPPPPLFPYPTLFRSLGFAAVILTARISMHMLAQPRVWPTFLLAQLGLFLMLFTRFWQRAAETSLSLQNPIPSPALDRKSTRLNSSHRTI